VKVLIYWASANRDEASSLPARFDADRASNRHLTFGAGPHLAAPWPADCLALEEVVTRLDGLRLATGPIRSTPCSTGRR
jgi:hypothetical protein